MHKTAFLLPPPPLTMDPQKISHDGRYTQASVPRVRHCLTASIIAKKKKEARGIERAFSKDHRSDTRNFYFSFERGERTLC